MLYKTNAILMLYKTEGCREGCRKLGCSSLSRWYSRTRFQKKTKQWEKKKPQKQIRNFGKKELSLFLKICFPQQKIHELRFKKNRHCKNNLPRQKRTLDKNFPWTFTWKMMSCISKRMDLDCSQKSIQNNSFYHWRFSVFSNQLYFFHSFFENWLILSWNTHYFFN